MFRRRQAALNRSSAAIPCRMHLARIATAFQSSGCRRPGAASSAGTFIQLLSRSSRGRQPLAGARACRTFPYRPQRCPGRADRRRHWHHADAEHAELVSGRTARARSLAVLRRAPWPRAGDEGPSRSAGGGASELSFADVLQRPASGRYGRTRLSAPGPRRSRPVAHAIAAQALSLLHLRPHADDGKPRAGAGGLGCAGCAYPLRGFRPGIDQTQTIRGDRCSHGADGGGCRHRCDLRPVRQAVAVAARCRQPARIRRGEWHYRQFRLSGRQLRQLPDDDQDGRGGLPASRRITIRSRARACFASAHPRPA